MPDAINSVVHYAGGDNANKTTITINIIVKISIIVPPRLFDFRF